MNMPDFRNNIRTCFDLAQAGNVIVVERNGVTFHILCPDTINGTVVDEVPAFQSTTGEFAHEFDDIMTTVTDINKGA